jgi:hypothetical protein
MDKVFYTSQVAADHRDVFLLMVMPVWKIKPRFSGIGWLFSRIGALILRIGTLISRIDSLHSRMKPRFSNLAS